MASGLNWQENLRPKLFCSMTPRDYTSFSGINQTVKEHFTGLFYTDFTIDSDTGMETTSMPGLNSPRTGPGPKQPVGGPSGSGDPGILLIGARNIVYKLLPSELRLTQTLKWPAEDTARDTCVVKGKTKDMCQNFVVVLQQFSQDPTRFMICGTNAFNPVCREYVDERSSFIERSGKFQRPRNAVTGAFQKPNLVSEKSGQGLAPFDPNHNSTAVLVGEDLYAGTVADFTGVDSIIFRYWDTVVSPM